MTSFVFRQNIYPAAHKNELTAVAINLTQLSDYLPPLLELATNGVVGLAPVYGRKGRLQSLALATDLQVIVIDMSSYYKKSAKNKKTEKVDPLRDFLYANNIKICAFEMDKVAAALFLDCGLKISKAIDLLSLVLGDENRYSLAARLSALGGSTIVDKKAVARLFRDEEGNSTKEVLAMQAWAARCAALCLSSELHTALPINTNIMEKKLLGLVAKVIRDGHCLRSLKPLHTKNDVDDKCVTTSMGVELRSNRYKTRVMSSHGDQRMKITGKDDNGRKVVIFGKVREVTGRAASVTALHGKSRISGVHRVETLGREQPTGAESRRIDNMLGVLQGTIDLASNPFIAGMWFGNKQTSWVTTGKANLAPEFYSPSDRELNASQKNAVLATLSTQDKKRIVLIHGPPGTGKTTVIAAIVTSIINSPDTSGTVWLVAQSNVAVKNIAEKLVSVGFKDFKILVSIDFHFDWHEHLYKKMHSNVICSNELGTPCTQTKRDLMGSRVILCTLSMLSQDKLSFIASLVPLQTVVFDEASQIESGDYLPFLIRFRPTLQKLVFIGDDKQLAPYGSSDVSGLESIFEKKHLRVGAFFLDTQYRMPMPIGNFISQHVYDGKLESHHSITDSHCCRFIDVSSGQEKSHDKSWKNIEEVTAVIAIARQLTAAKKSFRIITPYDPQRSLLETALKEAALPWQDKCFNIDSFQGNEDDYIIISLVRSHKLGFLRENRRVNVMLTRSKKGMAICSSRKFIEGPAVDSLVGKLSRSLPKSTWIGSPRVLKGEVQVFP